LRSYHQGGSDEERDAGGDGGGVRGGLDGAQGDPQPTCRMCPGTYIPKDEVDAYVKKAIAEKLTDQQVRDVEIGKAHIGIGVVHRGKLASPAPESVAEHDQVSEVYHIIEGTATLMLGPDIVGAKRRPATLETVRLFNGPGSNGASSETASPTI